jgi:hypothetical protein
VVSNAEMSRIRDLPIILPITAEEVEAISQEFVQAKAFAGRCKCNFPSCRTPKPIRLGEDQAAGVRSFKLHTGGLFDIDVGKGKTALAQICASIYFHAKPTAKILYLLPPNLVKELFTYHIRWARTHLNAWVPRWINLHKKTDAVRTALASSGEPGIYVLPYTLLSEEGASALLDLIGADLVIADEAHTLAGNRDTGRTKAFWPWVKDRKPKGVVMSGSFSKQTPEDYHKLAVWVLGQNCPLPIQVGDTQVWSAALESKASEKPLSREIIASMKPLVNWAVEKFPEDFEKPKWDVRTVRLAYQARFRTTPGVVKSIEGRGIDVGLHITNYPCREPGGRLSKMLEEADEDWVTPDGDEKVHALEILEVRRQLSAGFFLRHIWDMKKPGAQQAVVAFERKREYNSILRDFLRTPRARHMNLLVPHAVGNYMKREGSIKNWDHMFQAWKDWHEVYHKDLPRRDAVPVRIDRFKVEAIVKWAKEHKTKGGVIWVHHESFGDWISEALRESKIRHHRKISGDHWQAGDASDGELVIASSGAFGQGKNLQHYKHQILAQWCRTAPRMQQLLGRLHRQGQEAKVVIAHTLRVTDFDHEQAYSTLLDTIYDKQTHGGDRKLLIAEWRPRPREYPPDFLRERGFGLAQFGSQDEDQEEDDQ